MALADLPEDVLTRVLAGLGSRGIAAARACCKRLNTLGRSMAAHTCFASALSIDEGTWEECLLRACDRAQQGMLGGCASPAGDGGGG